MRTCVNRVLSDEEKYYRLENLFLILTILFEPLFFYLVLKLNIHLAISDFIDSELPSSLRLAGFFVILSIIQFVLFFPLSFMKSYYIEKKFALSNQTFLYWFKDHLKSNLFKGAVVFSILYIMYSIMQESFRYWWVITFIATAAIYLILSWLAPVLIFPLFFKFKPLSNEELKARLAAFLDRTGIPIKPQNIFEVDFSKRTNAANAAVMGFGKTKRIAFSDTLLEQFSPDEIEGILAHEAGHLKNLHHLKGGLLSIACLFIFFLATNLILAKVKPMFNIENITDPSSIPLFALLFSIEGILILPLINSIIRKFEFAADRFAVENSTEKTALISALNKLAGINLLKKKPNPIIEFLFHSHPSVQKRIDYLTEIVNKESH